MRPQPFWGDTDIAGQLLGFYEAEVLMEIESSRQYRVCLNIGAGDGYYCVGWLVAEPQSEISRVSIAFETDRRGQTAIRDLALLNGVEDRVTIYGKATLRSLMAVIDKQRHHLSELLIICDIEGAEYELFSEEILEALRGAKLIIEAHEFTSHMVGERKSLEKRAEKYFRVRTCTTGSRNPHQFDVLHQLTDTERWLVCAEGRDGPPGRWLVLE